MPRNFAVDIHGLYDAIAIVALAVSAATTLFKMRRANRGRRVATLAYVAWGEVLFYTVGCGLIVTGIFDWAASARGTGGTAASFPWGTVGLCEIGIAAIAVVSLWRGFEFRLAATIGFLFVAFGLPIGTHTARDFHVSLAFLPPLIALGLVALAFASRAAYERNVRW